MTVDTGDSVVGYDNLSTGHRSFVTGSLVVATMTVHGGGNGAQVFHWVCGLNAIAGQPFSGGLVR